MSRKTKLIPRMLLPVLLLLMLAVLTGCGGDGPIDGAAKPATAGTAVTPTGSVTLSLTKVSDNSLTSSVSVDSPVKLTAIAEDSSKRRLVLKVMTFSTTSDLLFDPASATALTDSNGAASIIIKAGRTTGATTIKAEITDYAGTAVSGTVSLFVTGSGTVAESISLALTKLSDNSATTSVSVDSPAKLTATAKDSAARPIGFKVMAFSAASDLSFDPASGTALTDANGTASVTVKAGNTTGATTIRAAITDSSGTAVSGTISLSVTTPNLSLSALNISPATLSAGGSAGVAVTVKDGDGNPIATSVPVSFTSNGVQAGKATITPLVNTVNGVASATYRDSNYGAVDTITATLTIGGSTFVKTGTVTVNPAAAGAISFVSATPANIALKGTGGAGRSETAVVVFKVVDTNGNPIKKKVNFSLVANTTVGGLSLTTYGADSDPQTGLVQTIVNAGTASTPVRVAAVIDGTAIATTSDQLVVSTGIPDQDSFSLTASVLNIEGWDFDGVTSNIAVRLADHFNNPVPEGTAVYFRTSGGSIQPSCTTIGRTGACTLQFTSQSPRPANGRAVVLAYALGEESFTDLNGNGRYDSGDLFTDLPEPFLDANENGARDADEEFVDTNDDGQYSTGDTIFNGILRDPAISGRTTTHVRNALTIVLAGSSAKITANNGNPISLAPCTDGALFINAPIAFDVKVTDVNGNAMPAGTTVAFATTNGTILTTPTSYTVPSTAVKTPPSYAVIMRSDALQTAASSSTPLVCTNEQTSGIFTVTVKTPLGLSTYATAVVTD